MTTEQKPNDNCMNFNKNTWHYRVVVFVFGKYFFSGKTYYHGKWKDKGYDTSLCEYFWTVLFCSFIFPFKGLWHVLPDVLTDHEDVAKALMIWAGVATGLHFYLIYPLNLVPESYWWFGIALYFGGIACALALIGILAVVFKLNDKLDDYTKRKAEEKQPDKPSKPSLLVEFLKAKKSKVCPCIKFVDEEKEDEKK